MKKLLVIIYFAVMVFIIVKINLSTFASNSTDERGETKNGLYNNNKLY
jgi:hypothetical protein